MEIVRANSSSRGLITQWDDAVSRCPSFELDRGTNVVVFDATAVSIADLPPTSAGARLTGTVDGEPIVDMLVVLVGIESDVVIWRLMDNETLPVQLIDQFRDVVVNGVSYA